MKKGDIIFVTGTDFQSKIIMVGTHSHWCHVAMIVDEDGTIVEAVNSGVQKANIEKYLNRGSLIVDVGLSDTDRERAIAYIQTHIGQKYDWTDIVSISIKTLFRSKISMTTEGKYICSGLIGEALERAGVSFEREGNTLAPTDLAKYYKVNPT